MRLRHWIVYGVVAFVCVGDAVRAAMPVPSAPPVASVTPVSSPSVALEVPPSIQSLLKPGLYQRVMTDKEILSSAVLSDERYSFYSVMAVRGSLDRARRVLTDYTLYSKLIPYVDKADYSPIMKTLDVQGGVWKWMLHSIVRFDERGDRWIHYTIVGGSFRGLQGDMIFEAAGEKDTVIYFRGELAGKEWPPKWVIERGAEIVFGFTAHRMRKYVESNEEQAKAQEKIHGQDLPRPRSHL